MSPILRDNHCISFHVFTAASISMAISRISLQSLSLSLNYLSIIDYVVLTNILKCVLPCLGTGVTYTELSVNTHLAE